MKLAVNILYVDKQGILITWCSLPVVNRAVQVNYAIADHFFEWKGNRWKWYLSIRFNPVTYNSGYIIFFHGAQLFAYSYWIQMNQFHSKLPLLHGLQDIWLWSLCNSLLLLIQKYAPRTSRSSSGQPARISALKVRLVTVQKPLMRKRRSHLNALAAYVKKMYIIWSCICKLKMICQIHVELILLLAIVVDSLVVKSTMFPLLGTQT